MKAIITEWRQKMNELGIEFFDTPSIDIETGFSIEVDYSQSLAEMMRGYRTKSHHRYGEITEEKFPPIETVEHGELELALISLQRQPGDGIESQRVTLERVLINMETHGFRPANIAELLSFGTKYPDVQMLVDVIALGSIWVDTNDCPYCGEPNHHYSPRLGTNYKDRQVYIYAMDAFYAFDEFLVVRKKK